MQDFDELKKLKAQCISDIREALPDYVNRLNNIDAQFDNEIIRMSGFEW